MINDFKEWTEDLYDRLRDIGFTLWDLAKAIWFLIAHIVYDPLDWIYIKLNNFFWYRLASKKMIYKWIKKNIFNGKAKNELSLEYLIGKLVTKNKLTKNQSSELKSLFYEKHPRSQCVFKIPKDTFDFHTE